VHQGDVPPPAGLASPHPANPRQAAEPSRVTKRDAGAAMMLRWLLFNSGKTRVGEKCCGAENALAKTCHKLLTAQGKVV